MNRIPAFGIDKFCLMASRKHHCHPFQSPRIYEQLMEDYLDSGDHNQAAPSSSGSFTLRDSGQSTQNFLEDMRRFMSGTQDEAKSTRPNLGGNNVVIGGGQGRTEYSE